MTEFDRAVKELRIAGLYDEDSDYGGGIGRSVEGLLRCIAAQGHSGFSHARTVELFERLATGGVLEPLMGTPDEWVDVSAYSDQLRWFQNKRCSSVFADTDSGEGAYDIDAEKFVERDGSTYIGGSKRVYITFPYTPRTKYVHVPKYSPRNMIRRFGKWLAKI